MFVWRGGVVYNLVLFVVDRALCQSVSFLFRNVSGGSVRDYKDVSILDIAQTMTLSTVWKPWMSDVRHILP